MKLQDQVITTEQAKLLKALGVRQESEYYWRSGNIEHVSGVNSWGDQETLGDMISRNDRIWSPDWRSEWDIFSAFTVAELGVMLPHPDGMYELGGFNHPSDFDPTAKDGKPWYCMWEYDTDKYGMKRQLFEGATEAEARAAILIYFLEINLIQVEEVNARLCA